jgi:hypothetical protein
MDIRTEVYKLDRSATGSFCYVNGGGKTSESGVQEIPATLL